MNPVEADGYRDLPATVEEAAPVFGTPGSGRDTCAVQVWEWDLSAGDLAAMMQAWLLEALSLLPSDIDAFEFTHWSALTAAHGGSDVTSASPLSWHDSRRTDVLEETASATVVGLEVDVAATWRWMNLPAPSRDEPSLPNSPRSCGTGGRVSRGGSVPASWSAVDRRPAFAPLVTPPPPESFPRLSAARRPSPRTDRSGDPAGRWRSCASAPGHRWGPPPGPRRCLLHRRARRAPCRSVRRWSSGPGS
jgi:hypothetical protein